MSSRDDLDEARARRIEEMLMYLGLHTRGFGCPEPRYYHKAMPAYGATIRQIIANAGRNTREIDITAANLPRIDGNVMYKNENKGGAFTLIGCHPMSFEARRRFIFAGGGILQPPPGIAYDLSIHKLVTPLTPVLEIRKVNIDINGQGVPSSPAYMAKPTMLGGRWVQLVGGEPAGKNGESLAALGFNIAVGMTMTMKTTWTVNLQFAPEAPGLCFITDPTGVREFFRFRDVPEGKARRSALVGWVTDHWRASRKDPNDEIYVREHLRGTRDFSWRSLSGSINIPEVDVKRNEEIEVRRKRLPAAEALRRRRLKP